MNVAVFVVVLVVSQAWGGRIPMSPGHHHGRYRGTLLLSTLECMKQLQQEPWWWSLGTNTKIVNRNSFGSTLDLPCLWRGPVLTIMIILTVRGTPCWAVFE